MAVACVGLNNCGAQALRTVCTSNPSYQSGSKDVKSIVLGQKAEFSPTAEKKGLGTDAISAALF